MPTEMRWLTIRSNSWTMTPAKLRADWNGDPQQLLDGDAVGRVAGDCRHVIETVGQGKDLDVGAVLGDLLDAPVKEADVRLNIHNPLAIQAHLELEHAVRAGVLRAHMSSMWSVSISWSSPLGSSGTAGPPTRGRASCSPSRLGQFCSSVFQES